MIAYIDLPLRGTNTVNGHDILVIGLYADGAPAHTGVIYIDQDGSMGQAQLSEVNINWRFDDNRRKWLDVDTGEDMGESDDGEQSDER